MTDPRIAHAVPLRDRHEALGASFTDFGGWAMPVRYTSDLAEHHAVRSAAGLFDISHMAEFLVAGARCGATSSTTRSPGRLSTLPVGKAKYASCSTRSGGIIDDVIVYRLADERFFVVANAGNRDAVAAALVDARAGSRSSRGRRDRRLRADRGAGPGRAGDPRCHRRSRRLRPHPLDELPYYAAVSASVPAIGRCSSPAPATRARTASSCYIPNDVRPALVGRAAVRRRRRTASCPPASPPATRCASRPACRSTATSSRSTSCRLRRVSAGSSPWTRRTSSAEADSPPSWRRMRRCSSASSRRASAPAAPATQCFDGDVRRWARSPAARSARPSGIRSPWRSSHRR